MMRELYYHFHYYLLLLLLLFLVNSCNVAHCDVVQKFIKSLVNNFRGQLPGFPSTATKSTNVFRKEYDFIIIGAGSGGSVVANRLSELKQWSVLLLEAGKEETLLTDIPLMASYVVGTNYDWRYKTERQEGICQAMKNQRCNWPRGKAMGGTSVINYMVYTRGFRQDYDNWEKMGNEGWGFKDVLPYFLKSENTNIPQLLQTKYHAKGGYLNVDRNRWRSEIVPSFMEACNELHYPMTDPSGDNPVGCSYVLSTTENGARLSASKAFLRPIRHRSNLHVGKECFVTKIVIDPITKKTLGVEFLKKNRKHFVRVKKEVILSAGTLNSPQLLMLSGIGPANHLRQHGINVIQDLKVGYNLQDHVSFASLAFLVNDTVTIVESRFRKPKYAIDYWLNRNGPYTTPGGAEAIMFTKTKYANETDAPDMELVFGGGAMTGDTGGSLRELMGIDEEVYQGVYGPYVGHDAWSLVPVLLNARSRGRVTLKSSNPLEPALFYPNYFKDERDLDALVDGVEQAVRIGKSRAMQKYNSKLLDNAIPGCEYLTFNTREYWYCAARQITTNLHHQVGTCKMGVIASDRDAVVDSKLKVYGISGLRVVDASIMPVIPRGHTNAVVLMIGEKASDMIKETWLNI